MGYNEESVTPMSEFVINGTSIFYEVKGDINASKTIAFFNGVMASTSSWNLLSPIFEKAGYRVVLHDFQGQLKSDKPDGPYTFDMHCAQAHALFAHLKVEEVNLIGTSYGGEMAMHYAFTYPSQVKTITVIDSVSELDAVVSGFVLGWKNLCDTMDGEIFFKGMAPSIYGPEYLANNKEFLEERGKALKGNPNRYLEGQKILYDTFVENTTMTHRLCEIKCPALVICGENDILKPVKFSKIIADNIPQSEFIVIPDCGHVAIFEKPLELESAIFGFIMKHSF